MGCFCLITWHRNDIAARSGQSAPVAAQPAGSQAPDAAEAADDDDEDESSSWSLEKRTAEELGADMAAQWAAPIDALSKAGKAFEGLEALLGGASGGSFDLKVSQRRIVNDGTPPAEHTVHKHKSIEPQPSHLYTAFLNSQN